MDVQNQLIADYCCLDCMDNCHPMCTFLAYSNLTVKNLAMMDIDKINYELIEALMEWFLEADHQVRSH